MFSSKRSSGFRRKTRQQRSGKKETSATTGFKLGSTEACRKWARVKRPPAAGVGFLIPTWVPVTDLTEEEQEQWDRDKINEDSEQCDEGEKALISHGAPQSEAPTEDGSSGVATDAAAQPGEERKDSSATVLHSTESERINNSLDTDMEVVPGNIQCAASETHQAAPCGHQGSALGKTTVSTDEPSAADAESAEPDTKRRKLEPAEEGS